MSKYLILTVEFDIYQFSFTVKTGSIKTGLYKLIHYFKKGRKIKIDFDKS